MSRPKSAPAKLHPSLNPSLNSQQIVFNQKDIAEYLHSKLSPQSKNAFAGVNQTTRQFKGKYDKFVQYNSQNPFEFYNEYSYIEQISKINAGHIIYSDLKHIYIIDKDLKSQSLRNIFKYFEYNTSKDTYFGSRVRSYIIPKELIKTNITVENLITMLLKAIIKTVQNERLSVNTFTSNIKKFLLLLSFEITYQGEDYYLMYLDTHSYTYIREKELKFFLIPRNLEKIYEKSICVDVLLKANNSFDITLNTNKNLAEAHFRKHRLISPTKIYKDIAKFDDIDYNSKLSYKTEFIDGKLYFTIFLYDKVLTFSLEDFENKLNIKEMIKNKLTLTLEKRRELNIWYSIKKTNKGYDEYCISIDLKKKTITLRSILNQDDSSNESIDTHSELSSSEFKLIVNKTARKSAKSL